MTFARTDARRNRTAQPARRGEEPAAPSLSCLVVDADSTDRRLLHDLLVRDGRVAVAGDVTDGSDLVRLVRHAGPDVLFLDARTPSDLLERMLAGERQLPCLVVLSSALASDAAVAYNAGAADFLLKPYGYARLDLAIARLQARLDELARLETPAASERGGGALAALDQRRSRRGSDTLTVASQGRIEYLPTSSIVWIASAGDEARIFATDRVVRARSSLVELAQRLDPQRFIRTHRGALVNVEMVRRLESSGAGGSVMLASGQTVPVAKRRIAEVRRALRLAQRRLTNVPAVRSA